MVVLVSLNVLTDNPALGGLRPARLFVYLVASTYVSLASGLGFALLVVPGLFILASTFLYPWFIRFQNAGPIEAVAESVAMTSGYRIAITLLFGIAFIASECVEFLLDLLYARNLLPSVLMETVSLSVYLLSASLVAACVLTIVESAAEEPMA